MFLLEKCIEKMILTIMFRIQRVAYNINDLERSLEMSEMNMTKLYTRKENFAWWSLIGLPTSMYK